MTVARRLRSRARSVRPATAAPKPGSLGWAPRTGCRDDSRYRRTKHMQTAQTAQISQARTWLAAMGSAAE